MEQREFLRNPNAGSPQHATRRLIRSLGKGSLRKAEQITGLSNSYLSTFQDICNPPPKGGRKRSIPVGDALAIEKATGNLVLTEYMAEQHGCLLVRPYDPENVPPINEQTVVVTERLCAAVLEGARIMEDGVVERHEALAWQEKLTDAYNAIALLKAALTKRIHEIDEEGSDNAG